MERALHSKIGIALIIVGSIFLLTAGAAMAAGAAKEAPTELCTPSVRPSAATLVQTDTISYTQSMTGGVMIPTCIGLFFGVDMTDVVTVRSEGLGWGEVAKAYFLAQDSGLAVEDIIALRGEDGEGMGWGEIFQYLGVPLSGHGRNLGSIISGKGAVSGTVPVAAQRLADRLGADAEDIAAMLEEGATYGTVVVAHKLAGQFDADVEELVGRRLGGESWGQIRRELKASASTTASGLSAPGGGNSHGHGNQNHGNQGQGKPHDQGNQGHGRGHDKEHGGGKKH